MSYLVQILILLEIYVLVAVSLNLLVGYSGLLQVAHAAYFGVGAYVVAILTTTLGWAFVPALLVGGVVAGVLSLFVSVPAWRFRGEAFILMSLAVQFTLWSLMLNWVALTGGPHGIGGIARPSVAGTTFATPASRAVLFGVVLALVLGLLALLQWSPFGRSLKAMRDDETAARSLGIKTRILKLQAFAIASGIAGIAGGLYAVHITFIDPTSFNLDASILMLSMVIVGGTGNFRGPLVGALVLVAVAEVLRFVALPESVSAQVQLLVYGLLLVLMMLWRPQGIAGTYRFE